jgi:hypothetical protein
MRAALPGVPRREPHRSDMRSMQRASGREVLPPSRVDLHALAHSGIHPWLQGLQTTTCTGGRQKWPFSVR